MGLFFSKLANISLPKIRFIVISKSQRPINIHIPSSSSSSSSSSEFIQPDYDPTISPKRPTSVGPLLPQPIEPILKKPFVDIASQYDLSEKLGQGAFAITYLCTEKSTGLKYACKSISKMKLVDPSDIEDVRREIKILQHLKGQTNIVEFKGVYEDAENVHLVMELCSGGTLASRAGTHSEEEVGRIVRQIIKIVHVCHFMGVMHRDLKPGNLMFVSTDADSPLKAIDFGVSTFIKRGEVYTDCVGTRCLMAPEVIRENYGKEIDMWSVGVTMYGLLTTLYPFWDARKSGDKIVMDQNGVDRYILIGKVDLESHPWPLISKSAKRFIKRMLTIDPKKRITAARALEHPWLKKYGEALDKPIESAILIRIKQFRAMNKLRKRALSVIAQNLPEEELTGLREMFKNMDTDGSDTITNEELKTGLTKLGSKLSDAEIRQLMEATDVDKDGIIDYVEFITATMNPYTIDNKEILEKAFHYFDKDKKGYITRDDLRQEHKMWDEATIEEVLDDVDTNKDGNISYDEFVAMMRKGTLDFGG